MFDSIHFEPEATRIRGKKTWKLKGGVSWICPGCGCLVPEETMRRQPAKWVADNPASYEKGVRSFWLNAFSSSWTPWEKIVLKFLDAQGDPQRLKVVYNTLLGQLWEDRGDLEDEDAMLARREDYGTRPDGTPVELPDGVLVLTCGVDTQDNRLEYEVVGHGKYGETWGIVKGYIMGRPDTPEVWQRLDDVVDHVYKFKNGRGLKISITCVDSGGHFTQEVYEACRARQGKRVFAIKGKGGDGIPYVSPPTKVPIRDNKKITCWLYTIGVDAGKAAIMANLKVQEPGPKYCHFNRHPDAGYDLNYFNGLLSEKLVLTTMKTRTTIEAELAIKRERLTLYLKREAEMLDGGVQSYGIGSRNLARYNTDLGAVRAAIKELEADIETLEGALNGQKPRRAVGVIPRDW